MMWGSVPQIATARTLHSTSNRPGTGRSTSSTPNSSGAVTTSARIPSGPRLFSSCRSAGDSVSAHGAARRARGPTASARAFSGRLLVAGQQRLDRRAGLLGGLLRGLPTGQDALDHVPQHGLDLGVLRAVLARPGDLELLRERLYVFGPVPLVLGELVRAVRQHAQAADRVFGDVLGLLHEGQQLPRRVERGVLGDDDVLAALHGVRLDVSREEGDAEVDAG